MQSTALYANVAIRTIRAVTGPVHQLMALIAVRHFTSDNVSKMLVTYSPGGLLPITTIDFNHQLARGNKVERTDTLDVGEVYLRIKDSLPEHVRPSSTSVCQFHVHPANAGASIKKRN